MSTTYVLITGGNRGLGRAYARALVDGPKGSSYTIGITARSQQAAESAARELSGDGRVVGYGCDIEKAADVEGLRQAVENDWGRVDVLINNAGAAYDNQIIEGTMSMSEAWARALSLNVTANHLFTHAFVPLLLRAPAPRLIFIGSQVGSISGQASHFIPPMDANPAPGWPKEPNFAFPSAYRTSKAAAHMMAREWARTLHNDGVKTFILAMSGYATSLNGTDPKKMLKGGSADPKIAGEWVREFVEGEHDADAGKLVNIKGEMGW